MKLNNHKDNKCLIIQQSNLYYLILKLNKKKFFLFFFRDLNEWITKTHQNILIDADQSIVTTVSKKVVPISSLNSNLAEEIVKRHMEIRDEINAKEYEFDYVKELGNRLLSKNPRLDYVNTKLDELFQNKKNLEDAWNTKEREYKQLLELEVFCREADRIDALTKGHEAFLDIENLGVIIIFISLIILNFFFLEHC